MKYHFIGIGGIGMSALARILLQRGIQVSGSDQTSSLILENLKKEGAQIFFGHSAENIQDGMTIVYSTAVIKGNPEFDEAKRRNLPFLHRSDLLQKVMDVQKPLLIGGTHGKTTTTSLLAHVLMHAGLQPSFAVGGIVGSLGTNGQHGSGDYFVAEADESDGTFLKYQGFGGIITNIDNDHLDYWKTEENLDAGFRKFSEQIQPQNLFICADDPRLLGLKLQGISYGFHEQADLRILSYEQNAWKLSFTFKFKNTVYENIELPLIGLHNVLNSSAVFGLSLQIGIEQKKIREAFQTFRGIGRRAEKKGEHGSIEIYDDYGHHPTEILATLSALKAAVKKRRLIVAFQPHRFTRTRDCWELFPEVFNSADELVITDIYSAGEQPIEGVTTNAFFQKLCAKKALSPHYFPRQKLALGLCSMLQDGDVLVTMGAGDITKVGPEVLNILSTKTL
jgi:UDP-N-acetylmuramate--alanine ligase